MKTWPLVFVLSKIRLYRIIHKSILPFDVTLSISFDLTTFERYITSFDTASMWNIYSILMSKKKYFELSKVLFSRYNIPVWRRSEVVPRNIRSGIHNSGTINASKVIGCVSEMFKWLNNGCQIFSHLSIRPPLIFDKSFAIPWPFSIRATRGY